MDALGIKKAHFGGLSMGGATALGLAQKHPDRLDKVIVCDSPCQSTPTSSQQWEERIVVAQEKGMEALVEPTVGRWFPPAVLEAKPAHIDKVRQMIRSDRKSTRLNFSHLGISYAVFCLKKKKIRH